MAENTKTAGKRKINIELEVDVEGGIYINGEKLKSSFRGGYPGYTIRFDAHQLVAQAFIPNPHKKPCIDHIDGNKTNNHVSNLRWATHSENQLNKKIQSNNTSGFAGVSFDHKRNKYRATFKKKFLGVFIDKVSAVRARVEAEQACDNGEFIRVDENEAEKVVCCVLADLLDKIC